MTKVFTPEEESRRELVKLGLFCLKELRAIFKELISDFDYFTVDVYEARFRELAQELGLDPDHLGIASQMRRHPLDGWNGWSTLPARCAELDKEFGDD